MPSFAISKFTVLLNHCGFQQNFCFCQQIRYCTLSPLLRQSCIRAAHSCSFTRCFNSALVILISSSNDSNGTFRNVPLLLSHACPCAEWFDAYIAVIVDYTKLRCNYVYVSGTMIFMSGAKSHIVLCIPSGIAEFVIKQFISFQWAYLVIPPL